MNRRIISYSLILMVGILYSSLSFALITSSDDVASKYELVGIISSNVVVLKDKQTGSSLTRRLGEPLSQELKISKIDSNSITLTSSAMGEDFTLTFDKFGSTVASKTSTPTPSRTAGSSVSSKVPAAVGTFVPSPAATSPSKAVAGSNTQPGYPPTSTPSTSASNELLPENLGSTNIANSSYPASNLPTTTDTAPNSDLVPPASSEVASSEEVPAVSELSPETLNLLDKFYEDPDSFSPEQIKDLEKRLLEGI